MEHMKITTKTIKTLHLQRERVDEYIRANVEEVLRDHDTLEDLNNELSFTARLVDLAVKGEYGKACQEGFTMFLLGDEEMKVVDTHFANKRQTGEIGLSLNLEVYDGEVFIDRVVENQIQY